MAVDEIELVDGDRPRPLRIDHDRVDDHRRQSRP